MVVLGLASCTSFDDPVTENYGNGPDIQVALTPGTPADNVFTMTLTPASGTTYYAFVIDQDETVYELDAQTLLKGGYGNTVLNTTDFPSFQMTIDEASPNSTYTVYAVACNDKGICGNVATAQIKTIDQGLPAPGASQGNPDAKQMLIQFSEAVTPGTGAIKVQYYAEWDIMNPVTVPAEEIEVATSGRIVSITTPTIPAGAYVTYSWAQGAFVDGAGNGCQAYTSGIDMTKGTFTGYYQRITPVAFEVTDENVTSPEDGSLFADHEAFVGVMTFDQNIYRNDETVEDGDVSVIYTSDKRTAVYKLSADQWKVEGKTLTFTLPAAPAAGELVTVSLVEGAITDVFGNPNAEFTSETSWKYFAMTADMAFGKFNLIYTSYFDETPTPYNAGVVSFDEYPDIENGILVSDFFLEGSQLPGYYDLDAGKVYIGGGYALGYYTNSKGTTYGLVIYNAQSDDDDAFIPFTVNADGSMVADVMWGVYAFDENFENALGWFEVASSSKLTPAEAAAAKARVLKKSFNGKQVKFGKKLPTLKKHVSK